MTFLYGERPQQEIPSAPHSPCPRHEVFVASITPALIFMAVGSLLRLQLVVEGREKEGERGRERERERERMG